MQRSRCEIHRIDWHTGQICQAPVDDAFPAAIRLGFGHYICGHASSWRVSSIAHAVTTEHRTACEEPTHLGLVLEGVVSAEGGVDRYIPHTS